MIRTLYQKVEQSWWSEQAANPILLACSHFYAYFNAKNLNKRQQAAITPAAPMISVGNITVGGSGKTPFIEWLAQGCKAQGLQPVILSRGDGGSIQTTKQVFASDPASLVGDEACMLAQADICPVVAGRDRVLGQALAAKLGKLILLDDGFQYRQLHRVCDIVLVPAIGLGNKALLPAGPLRQAASALKKADFLIRTGHGEAKKLSQKTEYRWQTNGLQLISRTGDKAAKPTKAIALCSIARAERFFQELRSLGIELLDCIAFPDHHRYQPKQLQQLINGHHPVITTSKDMVKLKSLWPQQAAPLYLAKQQLPAHADLLEAIIRHSLGHSSTNNSACYRQH